MDHFEWSMLLDDELAFHKNQQCGWGQTYSGTYTPTMQPAQPFNSFSFHISNKGPEIGVQGPEIGSQGLDSQMFKVLLNQSTTF